MSDEQARLFAETFDHLVAHVSQAVLGKDRVVRLALTTLVTEGHLLLEDVPGTGKTSLAKAIANTVDGTQSRIQFTPDLLPQDITGFTMYDQRTYEPRFLPGPIFATIVLADEINRASPKTQSALLEVMEEGHVTVEGVKHEVQAPFMVIATQNPIEQAGTYRLPEAQLDRFLMKTDIGYPDAATTVRMLAEASVRDRTATVTPRVQAAVVTNMARFADQVRVDESILEYVSRIATATREAPDVELGVSPRGCLALVRAAKTWAASHGRTFVSPDDVKELAVPVLAHRLGLTSDATFSGTKTADVVARILDEVLPAAGRVG